ncbi:ZP domain-containing protein [Caerostris extrusa]|uniref:ZP domain-containing protein n=1 Tax=Caerostris extrusa TaxID=172846 RepID=A0AAV4TGJ5_CAEEX|nr:ZP domain-containing protein [Caerostris extrusa]
METRDFACLSFNFRSFFPDNCELSDQDSHLVQIGSPLYFELDTQFDYYEREPTGVSPGCLDVSQSCTLDGMEFTLKTPEGFYGRMYTYGFYDTCFYDGNGGNVNVLRISRANGFPRCGTQQYGDVITNIVVVQFNDYVQTPETKSTISLVISRDLRSSCHIQLFGYKDGWKISHTNRASSRTKCADFQCGVEIHWEYFADIFATNVIAKDPYSGRQVHLIDARGCPVDLYVFPELHRTPDGALEAEFYAFKIPDSNLLVFQATVQTCRGPCEPVSARPEPFPSWGRKKRSAPTDSNVMRSKLQQTIRDIIEEDEPEEVHELFKVYLSRSDIPPEEIAPSDKGSTVCVAQAGYYGMIATVVLLMCLVVAVVAMSYFFIKRTRRMVKKMAASGIAPTSPDNNPYVSQFQVRNFADPSEPIYTDPSLFERPRNTLRSMTARTLGKLNNNAD